MDEIEKLLIVGLGNPGKAYEQTRHNIGFRLVHAFAEAHGMQFKDAEHLSGQLATGCIGDKKVLSLLPMTYMNSSGEAVRRCVDYFKVPIEHLIVVCDDVALPTAQLRLRSKGSDGGHNGLHSIETHLNTQYYARLRVGVGAPIDEILSDYVLGRFSEEEAKLMEDVTQKVIDVLDVWVGFGIAKAMQLANASKKIEEGETNG